MRLRYLTKTARCLACVLFFTVSLHALCPAQVDTNIPHDRWRTAVELALHAAQREEVQERKRPAGLEDIDSQEDLRRVISQSIRELGDPERDVQETAVRRLRYLGDEAFDALVESLQSGNPTARMWAAKLLRRRGVPAVEPLCEVLRSDPDSFVRDTAALSLGSIHSSEAVPALIDALKEEAPNVQSTAIGALALLRDKRATQPLIDILESNSRFIREGTADALLQIDFDAAKRALVRVAQDEEDEYLRSRFLRKAESERPPDYAYWPPELLDLHQLIRDATTLAGEEYGDEEIRQLLEHINSSNRSVTGGCLYALGNLRATEVVPDIIEASEKRSDDISGYAALAKIASPEAIAYLARAVRSPDVNARTAAVDGLREGGRWAVPLLIPLLDDQDLRIKWHKTGWHVWPAQHWAHSALFSCLWRLGFKGEHRNLAAGGYLNVDEEIAGLKEWWSSHGQDFLEGKSVPTPRISALHASH